MLQRVFKVTLGHGPHGNWDSIVVIAEDALDAIEKATKHMSKGDFALEVEIVTTLT